VPRTSIEFLKLRLKLGVISYGETPPRGYGACERVAYQFARHCDATGWNTRLLAMQFRQDIDYGGIDLVQTRELYEEDDVTLLDGLDLVFAFHPGAAFQLIRLAIEQNTTHAWFGVDVSWPELVPEKRGRTLPTERVLCFPLCNRVADIYLRARRPFRTFPLILYPDELPTLQEAESTRKEDAMLWMANADPGRGKDLEAAIALTVRAGCRLIAADGGEHYRGKTLPPHVTRMEAVYGEDKRRLFASCKAFLYTHPRGDNEAGGTAILEALYSGLPVYALNFVPGSPADTYVINGFNGFCSDSIDYLAEAYRHVDGFDPRRIRDAAHALLDPVRNAEYRLLELLRFAGYM
jgi:hypothetical protein